jgi:hypothetical protein
MIISTVKDVDCQALSSQGLGTLCSLRDFANVLHGSCYLPNENILHLMFDFHVGKQSSNAVNYAGLLSSFGLKECLEWK